VKKQLAAKAAEADSLSRRVGAVNSLTTAFEQVGPAAAWMTLSAATPGLQGL
jgi:hypothetical protein